MEFKNYLLIIASFFFIMDSSAKNINESLPIKKILTHNPLMASHLPRKIQEFLPQLKLLSYTSGHEFYDTPIVLIDEQGTQIKYKEELKTNHHYNVTRVGQTRLMAENIWFFSPNGQEPSDFFSSCTAERPCKEITQRLIEDLEAYLKMNKAAARLWFASGTYNLPNNTKQHNAAMVDLYGNISIKGRTADFRHIAYGEERPLLKGTLSWNDYAGHGGTIGLVENIRIYTQDNRIQVEDTFVNVNIHSAGYVVVEDSDLQKINPENNSGGNIFAHVSNVYNSTLSAKGNSAFNIKSPYAYLMKAYLKVTGSDITNIDVSEILTIEDDSHIESELDSCYFNVIFGKETSHSQAIMAMHQESVRLLVANSHIVMNAIKECPQSREIGIQADAYAVYGPQQDISVMNSTIDIKSYHEAVGIYNGGVPVRLNNTTMTIEGGSDRSMFNSVYAFSGWDTEISYLEKPSFIHLISLWGSASVYNALDEFSITNGSIPPSQCQINDETQQNC